MESQITIAIKPETWKKMNGLKSPGQSFDDIIKKFLEDQEV